MNEINLVKKTYEELQDEVIKLTTDKFLLKTKIENAIEYIGYYNMLDTIVEQIKECSYEKRIEYIDRYIEIMKLIIELKEKGE